MLQLILVIVIGTVIGRILWQPLRKKMILDKIEEMEND